MARVNDFTLERYVQGELPEGERAVVEALLTEDPELQARVEALREADQAFLAAHPPGPFVAEVVRRHRSQQLRRYGVVAGAGLALAAAALLTVGALSGTEGTGLQVPTTGSEQVRIKGDTLKVFQDREGQPLRLRDGDTVLPGSVVQVQLAPELPYGAVYSVDGRGSVTRHWPVSGKRSAELEARSLPNSFTLDEVPDFERFFLVSSAQPFPLAPVESALGALDGDPDAPLGLAPTFSVDSVLIDKVYP